MLIRENIPISELTTMRLGGPARFVATVTSPVELVEAVDFATERHLPLWVMGAGANTLGHDEGFPGLIVLNRIKGISTLSETDHALTIKAMAGEVWDDVVEFACKKGFSGIEAMSKIPGTAGAAPVQNIGAYGQDISQTITEVEAFDLRSHEFVTIAKPEMKLSYRHTRFNFGADAGRFIIVSLTLELTRTTLRPPFYTSLQNYVESHGETDFSPANIRRMVSEIRAAKLPDPADIPSAGSFFKNVNLPASEVAAAEAKGIPVWKNPDGSGKINSGWLIEACGLKGAELHGFTINEQAALVLMNTGAKSYADLTAARSEIIAKVREQFGFTLEQEPVELVPAVSASSEPNLAKPSTSTVEGAL